MVTVTDLTILIFMSVELGLKDEIHHFYCMLFKISRSRESFNDKK